VAEQIKDDGMDQPKLEQLSLNELINVIDEQRLRCWFLNVFHGYSVVCGHCKRPLSNRARKAFLEYRWTRCANCGKKVHFFRNTLLGSAKITPSTFFLLASFLQLEVPVAKISQSLGISKTAVRWWAEKINRYNLGMER